MDRSAVKAGYLKDDYVQYFAKKKVKRSPIINRGKSKRKQKRFKTID